MQLTMRKFDVKKNCLTTKDLIEVDYDNFSILIVESLWYENSDFVQKNNLSLCNNYKY